MKTDKRDRRQYFKKYNALNKERQKAARQKRLHESNVIRKIWYKANKARIDSVHKKWCEKNKLRIKALHKIWCVKNRQRRNAINKIYYDRHQQVCQKRRHIYHLKNRDEINKKQIERWLKKYHADPIFRMISNTRRRIRLALHGQIKSGRTLDLLGCSIFELRDHLESKFLVDMNWNNYGWGKNKWNIDHKRPLASFDLNDSGQQRKAFHFSNLQPLWQIDNFSKGAKYCG